MRNLLITIICLVALAVGAMFPLRSGSAQFIDRIIRPCSAGATLRASVIVNPSSSGNVAVTTCTGGSLTVNGAAVTTTPPGANTQVIFNDAGAFGADAGMTYAKATDALTVAGSIVTPLIQGLLITNNGTNTLNIAAGKTLTISNTITETATDGASVAFGLGGTVVYTGLITSSGLTQNTNKLLGRGTAALGGIEEITLGTGLSFTGTTLNNTGAPVNATYITQTPDTTLSAEQALSTLATGILGVTTATGVVNSITTSAGIASNISDETGTGVLTFATSPTFTTGITVPLVIGGITTTSTLTLQSTSGAGTTGADIIFKAGNNGATTIGRGLNNGDWSFGTGDPAPAFDANTAQHFLFNNSTANGQGELGIGGNTTGTSAGNSQLDFVNTSLGSADKRLAVITAATAGATNSGLLDFYTANAGTLNSRFTVTATGIINFSNATFYSNGTPGIAGNGTLNANSDDSAGKITATGTGASTIVLTFANTFTRAPACFVTNETTSNLVRPISTTTTLTVNATIVNGDSISYLCLGY